MSDIVERLRKRQMMQDVRGTGDRFVKQVAVPDALCQLAADEIDRLRAELAELRADAERYRWLRDNRVGTVAPEEIVTTHMELTFTWYSPTWENGERQDPVSLDAAIDRARGSEC